MNKKYKKFIEEKKKHLYSHCTTIHLDNITKPLTILLGPNGTGKSTSMRTIEQELKNKEIKFTKYSTSHDDIVQKSAPAFGDWDIAGIACSFHSEGERMSDSFFKWMNSDVLRVLLEDKTCPVAILIDESDSGLSIDKICETYSPLLFILEEELKNNRDIKIVITCNSYELAEYLDKSYAEFIWVPTKEHITLGSYNSFKKRYLEYWEEMKTIYDQD